MFKYFKYIVKKDFKNLVLLNALLILFNGILPYIFSFINKDFSFVFSFISAGISFYILFKIMKFLSNDLFSDERYFIYTLDIPRYKISTAKILYSFMFLTINSIVSTINYFYIGEIYIDLYKSFNIHILLITLCLNLFFISYTFLAYTLGKKLFNSKSASIVIFISLICLTIVILFIISIGKVLLLLLVYLVNLSNYSSYVITIIIELIIMYVAQQILNRTDL